MDDTTPDATSTLPTASSRVARPVVVLHGSYHQPRHFRELALALEAAGHPVAVPDLGGRLLSAQVDIAQRAVDGFDVAPVVVAHSFGGAAAGALRRVAHMIFLSAWVLDAGECASVQLEPHEDTAAARDFLGALSPAAEDGLLQLDPVAARSLFYGRCAPAVADRAVGLLRPDTAANFGATSPRTTWREYPTTYLRPNDDRTWPTELLDRYAARAGTIIDIEGADHSVWLSRPDVVIRVVRDIAH